MIEAIAIVSLFGLIALVFVKLFAIYRKLTNAEPLYPEFVALLSLALAWVFWLFVFLGFSASAIAEDTITTPDGETYAISSNEYVGYSLYLPVASFFASLATIFSIAEVLLSFASFAQVRQPMKRRVSERWGYR